jgi:hypothetical protein
MKRITVKTLSFLFVVTDALFPKVSSSRLETFRRPVPVPFAALDSGS